MKSELLYINRIEVVSHLFIRTCTIVAGTGVVINGNYWSREFPLIGLAELSVTSSVTDKSRSYKSKITANLQFTPPFYLDGYCYLLTSVSGKRFLVGAYKPPFPIYNIEGVIPGKASEGIACTLTVEYTDTLGLMPVIG